MPGEVASPSSLPVLRQQELSKLIKKISQLSHAGLAFVPPSIVLAQDGVSLSITQKMWRYKYLSMVLFTSSALAVFSVILYWPNAARGAHLIPGLTTLFTEKTAELASQLGACGANAVLNAYFLLTFFVTVQLKILNRRRVYIEKTLTGVVEKSRLSAAGDRLALMAQLIFSMAATIPQAGLSNSDNSFMITAALSFVYFTLNWSGAGSFVKLLGELYGTLYGCLKSLLIKLNLRAAQAPTYQELLQKRHDFLMATVTKAHAMVGYVKSDDQHFQAVKTALEIFRKDDPSRSKYLDYKTFLKAAFALVRQEGTTGNHNKVQEVQEWLSKAYNLLKYPLTAYLTTASAAGYYLVTWLFFDGVTGFSALNNHFLSIACFIPFYSVIFKFCLQMLDGVSAMLINLRKPLVLNFSNHGGLFALGSLLIMSLTYLSVGTALVLQKNNLPIFVPALADDIYTSLLPGAIVAGILFNSFSMFAGLNWCCTRLAIRAEAKDIALGHPKHFNDRVLMRKTLTRTSALFAELPETEMLDICASLKAVVSEDECATMTRLEELYAPLQDVVAAPPATSRAPALARPSRWRFPWFGNAEGQQPLLGPIN